VSITSISPVAAHHGDTVTISGNGFGGPNVKVTVGGVVAQVLSATGASAKFVVPATAPFGQTTVRTTNPGGQFGEIGFEVVPLLSQVTATASPDGARRVSKTIGRFGGTLETDGADGTHYRLDVPAGALSADTQISIAPAGVSGLDLLADHVSAAVDFAPDGLQFAVAAYLTITLPGPAGKTFAASFHSGAPGVSFLLGTVSGNVITVPVEHFSDLTIFTLRAVELDQAIQSALASAPQLTSPQLAQLVVAFLSPGSGDPQRDALATFLLNLYQVKVQPAIVNADKTVIDFELAYDLVRKFGGIVQAASHTGTGSDIYATGSTQTLQAVTDQAASAVSAKGETLFNTYSDSSDPHQACTGQVDNVVDWLVIPLQLATVLQKLGNPVSLTPCLTPHVETLVPFPATIDASVQTLTATFQAGLAAPKQTPDGIPIGNPAGSQQFFPEPSAYSLSVQGATFAGGDTSLDPISGPDGTITVQLDRGPNPGQRAPTVTLAGTVLIGDLGTQVLKDGGDNIAQIEQTSNQTCTSQTSTSFHFTAFSSLTHLDSQCSTVSVTVNSATITLTPGQQTTFTATVAGASDQTVGWAATGGTIDQNGTYTAGPTAGTYTVTATSNADPTADDTAAVTILQDAGVTRVRSQGYVGIGCDDTGPPEETSPDQATSWAGTPPECASDIQLLDGNGNIDCEYGSDTSGNLSFQEAYASNGDLLSAHTTGSINADAWGTFDQQTGLQCLGSGGGSADYSITFSVAHDATKVTVQGTDSGSGHAGADVRIWCTQTGCTVPYIAPHQGSFTQTLALDAGTYRFDCHLNADTTQTSGATSCDAEIRFG
jgi:hypothetical protein